MTTAKTIRRSFIALPKRRMFERASFRIRVSEEASLYLTIHQARELAKRIDRTLERRFAS